LAQLDRTNPSVLLTAGLSARQTVGPMRHDVILLRSDAPAKPALGQPCNGCGVCCAWAPCPLGMLLSRRRQGPCRALVWQAGQYRCGVLVSPRTYLRWLPGRLTRALARRWIGAAQGCDADLQAN
jgi:hypothetical protein